MGPRPEPPFTILTRSEGFHTLEAVGLSATEAMLRANDLTDSDTYDSVIVTDRTGRPVKQHDLTFGGVA